MQREQSSNPSGRPDTDTKPPAPSGVPAASTAIGSGKPIDDAGGPVLGQPPSGDGAQARPQPPEKRASDLQDRREDNK
jgi:hypothetical protein